MGRVSGHRGLRGEVTVRVFDGDAATWDGVSRVRILPRRDGDRGGLFVVEHSRAYRDRLVLKLEGIDDATRAAHLRGATVGVPESLAPDPGPGHYYPAQLAGCEVVEEHGRPLGRVRDVMRTGGTDLLVVERYDAGEDADDLLIPLTASIVRGVDRERERISVRLPQGLLELNRPETGR